MNLNALNDELKRILNIKVDDPKDYAKIYVTELNNYLMKNLDSEFLSEIDESKNLYFYIDTITEELRNHIKENIINYNEISVFLNYYQKLLNRIYYFSYSINENTNEDRKTNLYISIMKECYEKLIHIANITNHIKLGLDIYNRFNHYHSFKLPNYIIILNESISYLTSDFPSEPSDEEINTMVNFIDNCDFQTLNALKSFFINDEDEISLLKVRFEINRLIKFIKFGRNKLEEINNSNDERFDESINQEKIANDTYLIKEFFFNDSNINFLENNAFDLIKKFYNAAKNCEQDVILKKYNEEYNKIDLMYIYLRYAISCIVDLKNNFSFEKSNSLKLKDIVTVYTHEVHNYATLLSKAYMFGLNNILEVRNSKLKEPIMNAYLEKDYENFKNKYLNYSKIDPINKKQLCIEFLNSIPKDYIPYSFKHSNEEIYNFINSDAAISSTIAFSQKQIDLVEGLTSSGDYTSYVAGQLKVVERLIKEILVQKFPREIYLSKDNKFTDPLKFKRIDLLTSENLSSKVKDDNGNYCHMLELGNAACALAHCLYIKKDENDKHVIDSSSKYQGIFRCEKSSGEVLISDLKTTLFYKNFADEIRNGYFHIDIISNVKVAKEISSKCAYWFKRIIDEMLTYYPNFKLKVNHGK